MQWNYTSALEIPGEERWWRKSGDKNQGLGGRRVPGPQPADEKQKAGQREPKGMTGANWKRKNQPRVMNQNSQKKTKTRRGRERTSKGKGRLHRQAPKVKTQEKLETNNKRRRKKVTKVAGENLLC